MPFEITEDITLRQAVTDVAILVGFPPPADPVGSTDPAVRQLVKAVNEAGRELMGMYPWNVLSVPGEQIVSEADIVPPATYAIYDLPADFLMFVDQTQWNKSSQLPAIGPVNPQDWQMLQVRTGADIMYLTWRVRGGKLQVRNPGSSDQLFVYEYISKGWVQDSDNPTLLKNVAKKNSDILRLDDFLIVRLARAKWLEYKGFDNMGAMRDFLNSAESRFGQEKGAQTLSLINSSGYRYLGYLNMPDTSYGV